MIIFGRRLLGKTEAVPGVFYVHTRFFHVNFMPLCPDHTYLILELRGEANRAIEIPMSSKSITVAWLRYFGVVGAFFSLIGCASGELIASFALLLLSCGFIYFAFFAEYFEFATYERATELCSHMGALEPLFKRKIDRHFSRSDGVVIAEAIILNDDDDLDREEGFQDEVQVEITEIPSEKPKNEKANPMN